MSLTMSTTTLITSLSLKNFPNLSIKHLLIKSVSSKPLTYATKPPLKTISSKFTKHYSLLINLINNQSSTMKTHSNTLTKTTTSSPMTISSISLLLEYKTPCYYLHITSSYNLFKNLKPKNFMNFTISDKYKKTLPIMIKSKNLLSHISNLLTNNHSQTRNYLINKIYEVNR